MNNKIINWLRYKVWQRLMKLLMQSSPRWLIILIDLVIIVFGLFLAYEIRFNFSPEFFGNTFRWQILIVVWNAYIVFLLTKTYQGVVRHTGEKDIKTISWSMVVLLFLLIIETFLSRQNILSPAFNFPLSVSIMTAFFGGFFMVISRLIYKAFYYKISRHGTPLFNVLIYGTDDNAVKTLELLYSQSKYRFNVKGFLNDKNHTENKKLHGLPIFDPQAITPGWIKKHEIDQVIVASEVKNPLPVLEKLGNFTRENVKIKTIPPPDKWIDRFFSLDQILDFDLENLLNRVPIKMNDEAVLREIQGKTVLVTGAAGSIGSELTRQIIQYKPAKILLLDQAETPLYELELEILSKFPGVSYETLLLDIADTHTIKKILHRYQPDMIFHAAAYKHVPVLEKDPYPGIYVNVLATKRLMELAAETGISKFIQISTDKAVNPANVMGATKRLAELIARCLNAKYPDTSFIITRFGNVLGSNGSVIHLFKRQIRQGGPVTVTHKDITRYFMTIPEAVQLVLKAAEKGKGGEIFVFDMGKPVRIFDLAVKMIQLSGKQYPEDIDIKIIGLRPGEKLKEELLTNAEDLEKTDDEKLYISKLQPVDCEDLEQNLNLLEKVLSGGEMEKAVKILKRLIPEYRSNHSYFEKLD